MPMKEAAPLECIDSTPGERRYEGKAIWWCRVMVKHGEKLENGPLCTDSTHPMVIYGRRVQMKGEVKLRDQIFVCSVCKPQKRTEPPKRTYAPEMRFEVPEPYLMSWDQLQRIVGVSAVREPPWYPGPEPKPLENPTAEGMADYRREHRDWERWSRQCWSARCSLVSLRQKADEQPQSQSLRDFEL
jgi:hypothetical protein